jgi:hypothetical protein
MNAQFRKFSSGRQARIIAIVGALVASLAGAIGTAAPASADGGRTWTVVNASGGIYWRNSPHWNDTLRIPGDGAYDGDKVFLNCWQWGDPVGPYNNRVWWEVADESRGFNGTFSGGWISDHFIDTPTTANHPLAGIPEC